MEIVKHTLFFCCFVLWESIEAVLNKRNGVQSFVQNYNGHFDTNIHKVSFTQKGYIQFLRYISHVPPITDYTFCIWVRSNNLTYAHPLLSYSKHEEERLIRVWISPHGTDINLEILQHPIFKIPTNFIENHWYHVCQSWCSSHASWTLYLNGKLKTSGFAPQLRGAKIKGGGDIVVGQEYTDFDKGLDDGIEGDVFGFNFVLSPTTFTSHDDFPSRGHHAEVPSILSYFSMGPNRQPKFFEFFGSLFGLFDTHKVVKVQPNFGKKTQFGARVGFNDLEEVSPKSTGLKLVELSYYCYLGKGAPVSGKDVLISWTKTPVRVFGGAILKTIKPFCT